MKLFTLLRQKALYIFSSLLFILSALSIKAQPVSQTFNASGTYIIPAGYSAILTIEAWGAGGGGGTGSGGRGGGGGGAYASRTTTLAAGSYTVTVGTGPAGTAGGNSSFTALVVAGGGGAGGAAGGAAGTGTTGTTQINGTVGSGPSGNDGGAGGAGGNGGGAGGAGGLANNGNGSNGTAPGGGGGGKAGPGGGAIAGDGGNGRVIVTVNTVLPVTFTNIKAFEKQSGIQIEWTAYAELNLVNYQVERSADGAVFGPIGYVAALNSNTETRYGFFDANPLPGINFYRLKNIDLDGKIGLSSVVKVNLDKNAKDISIYPSPVIGSHVSFQSSNLAKGLYTVRIITVNGQQVYNQRFNHSGGAINQTIQLPADRKPGLYTLQLTTDAVKVMSKSFMVQ